jgi:hypothetical protein
VFGRGHVRSLVSAIKTYPDFRTDPQLRIDTETRDLLFSRGYMTRKELGVLAGTRGRGTRGPTRGPGRLPTWESICGSTPDSAQDSAQDSAEDSCDTSEGTDEETADDDDSNEDSRDSRDSRDGSEDGSDYASSDDNLSCGTSDEAVGPDDEQTPAGGDLSKEVRILKECFSANPVAVSA